MRIQLTPLYPQADEKATRRTARAASQLEVRAYDPG